MPYIKQDRRDAIKVGDWPETAGELNYVFTVIALAYWKRHHNYQGINDIVGALEGAKMEFYRRRVVFYEDRKIAENGDVS